MHEDWIGIVDMAQRSGLSVDTLRWYEKEGMVPPVPRGPDGRRRYGRGQQSVIRLLTALRAAGMPTREMKEFAAMVTEGAASHGRRIQLLEANRGRLAQRRAQIDAAEDALELKIAHYRQLIAAGLDCDGQPIPARPAGTDRQQQRPAGSF